MDDPTPFTAIILAGDRGPNDPVAQTAGVSCKALCPVDGQPMVLRVLAALEASPLVAGRLLCGPPWPAVEQNVRLHTGIATGDFGWLAPEATPSASAAAALQTLPAQVPVLLTTADHALLSARVIDYFCTQASHSGCDAVAALARYEQVAAAYPGIRRTVLKFQDDHYCSCNLFAFLTPQGRAMADFWRRIEQQRKRPVRMLGVLGWTIVLRYLLGRLSLSEALARLSRRLGLRLGFVLLPFPEAAVDVDSVDDWMFVRRLAGSA